MRLGLAVRCFFRVLFGRPLPPELQLPAPAGAGERGPGAAGAAEHGAVALLRLLQREGRFVDFVQEGIDGYADEQVGAAARAVHAGCRRVLERYLVLAPVLAGAEGEPVTVEADFDPAAIELVGNVHGSPPMRGLLRHHGWRAERVELPAIAPGAERIVAPAEVEIP
ncbi:MAG: DUF2760 domain-containing protein [Planctomycetota bacterium]|nr:MAG: DUF2760 domain-containing protein [Planctomycetota bacterium]